LSVRIHRQHWQALLGELEDARRQRHLLTYRALVERLQLLAEQFRGNAQRRRRGRRRARRPPTLTPNGRAPGNRT